ncbi:MAG: formylglycine-generating enzyme family protein [bacterium]
MVVWMVARTANFTRAAEPVVPEMVAVPGGDFVFGGENLPGEDLPIRIWAVPRQTISCPTFSIARDETTTAEFARFIQDGGYDDSSLWDPEIISSLPDFRKEAADRYPEDDTPCVGLNYYEAEAYCAWLARKTGLPFRLPTEIEWEKAARGTDGRVFPWGNEWNPLYSNWGDDTDGDRAPDGKIDHFIFYAPVGSFPEGKSPYGCYDMAGNVWEWCASWLEDANGTKYRVLRGGSYRMASSRHLSAFYRGGARPETGSVFHAETGFRIAKSES